MTALPFPLPALSARLSGRALGLALLLSLAACTAPAPTPPAPPAAEAPAPIKPTDLAVPPAPRPDRPAPPPGPRSETMRQYLASVQDALLARGRLRTDSGADLPRPTPAQLADEFVAVALHDEYQMQNGRLVPQAHSAPLRRWSQPVRMSIAFSDSVTAERRRADERLVRDFAARLRRVSGHPISVTPGAGNFAILIADEDARRVAGPLLRELVPGIPASDVAAIEKLAPQNYCTVFTYSPDGGGAYTNAIAVIRSELPDRLRLSCIHEELTQGLGLANDSPDARPSIFNDDEEFAYLTWQDELLLKMLYDRRLRPGMDAAEARPIAETIAAELLGTPSS